MNVVFVCTGNICRSPMAELILRSILSERGIADVQVASAGTWAESGRVATPEAVEVMGRSGLDGSSHAATEFIARSVVEADLIVAMTSVHRREILGLDPEAGRKLVLLNELHELEPAALEGPDDAPSRLDALLRGTRPTWRRSMDVDDPMGLPLAVYDRCFAEVRAGVERLVTLLWPEATNGANEPRGSTDAAPPGS